jgi:hypothetical protein
VEANMEKEPLDLEFVTGVRVTSFLLSVTFFPSFIKSGNSNDLFLRVVSAVADIFEEHESQLHWSIRSIRDNSNQEGNVQ